MRRAGAECEGAFWGGLGALGTPHPSSLWLATFPSRGRLWGVLGWLGCGRDTSSVKPLACHLPLKGKAFGGVWGGLGAVGDTSYCAPNFPFGKVRCCGRLILRRRSTGAPAPKRSTSRASPLRSAPPSPCAPKRSFGLFRCCAWLILHKQSTGLFIPKRSCSRASPLWVNPQGEGFWGCAERFGI